MPDDPRSSEPTPETAPDDRGDPASTPAPSFEEQPIENMPVDSTVPESGRGFSLRNAAVYAAAAIGAVVLLVVAAREPAPVSPVATDRLGPAPGEQIQQYLDDARVSLDGADTDPRWALVSFTEYLTAQQIPAAADGLRVSGVIQHVPVDRVQTPVIIIAVPAGDEPAVKSADAAAGLVAAQPVRDARGGEIARLTETRLRAGCACTAGIVVRGTLPQLRDLATRPGVRAVQALPADAVAGRFAVSPLLPGSTDIVTPTPDDGPVPSE